MKKINLFNKYGILKDIRTLKKKEPFTKLDDDEFLNVYSVIIGYLLVFGIAVIFDIMLIELFMPFIGLTGINIYFIKEFVKLGKRKKAEKNMEKVVKTLEANNIQTNTNRLSNSIIKTADTNETLNTCYLFLDKEDKLNGIYEEININDNTINYYTLNNCEVTNISQGKRKVLTKSDTIVRRR